MCIIAIKSSKEEYLGSIRDTKVSLKCGIDQHARVSILSCASDSRPFCEWLPVQVSGNGHIEIHRSENPCTELVSLILWGRSRQGIEQHLHRVFPPLVKKAHIVFAIRCWGMHTDAEASVPLNALEDLGIEIISQLPGLSGQFGQLGARYHS